MLGMVYSIWRIYPAVLYYTILQQTIPNYAIYHTIELVSSRAASREATSEERPRAGGSSPGRPWSADPGQASGVQKRIQVRIYND